MHAKKWGGRQLLYINKDIDTHILSTTTSEETAKNETRIWMKGNKKHLVLSQKFNTLIFFTNWLIAVNYFTILKCRISVLCFYTVSLCVKGVRLVALTLKIQIVSKLPWPTLNVLICWRSTIKFDQYFPNFAWQADTVYVKVRLV